MLLKMRVQVKSKRKRKPPKRLEKEYKKQVQNLQRSIGMKGVNNIRSEIKKENLISSGEMYDSVNYKMTPQGVSFSVHEKAKYLMEGVKPHQMQYLTKSKSPIPIPINAWNTLFRWASPKSMAEGKWQHPGLKPNPFMERAVKRTRKDAMDQFKEIAKKVLR